MYVVIQLVVLNCPCHSTHSALLDHDQNWVISNEHRSVKDETYRERQEPRVECEGPQEVRGRDETHRDPNLNVVHSISRWHEGRRRDDHCDLDVRRELIERIEQLTTIRPKKMS